MTNAQIATLNRIKSIDREAFVDEMEGANAVIVAPTPERVFIVEPSGRFIEE
jgi:hypothetical protein